MIGARKGVTTVNDGTLGNGYCEHEAEYEPFYCNGWATRRVLQHDPGATPEPVEWLLCDTHAKWFINEVWGPELVISDDRM